MQKQHNIVLDLYATQPIDKTQDFKYELNDKEVYPLFITLKDRSGNFNIPQGATVQINFVSSVGEPVPDLCTIVDADNGRLSYNVEPSKIARVGTVTANIQVFTATERLSYFQGFSFTVWQAQAGNGTIPPAVVPWTDSFNVRLADHEQRITELEENGSTGGGGGDIPTKVSQLINDSLFVDETQLENAINDIDLIPDPSFLFFTADGKLDRNRPTGVGTTVLSTVINTTTPLFTNIYTVTEDKLIHLNSTFKFHITYKNLVIGETYQFRLRLVFAGQNIEDTTRPAFIADNEMFVESYTEVNDLTENLQLTTGALMIAQIFAVQGAGTIGMLVENAANPSRITENEIIDNTPATNVSLNIAGVQTTVQSFSMDVNRQLKALAMPKAYGTSFILLLKKIGLLTTVANGSSRNLFLDVNLSPANISVISGRTIDNYTITNGFLKLPISRNDPTVHYDITIRMSGTTSLGTKNYQFTFIRSDGVVLGTNEIQKTATGALDKRGTTFFVTTITNTDLLITGGFQVLLNNISGADFIITAVEFQIRGSDT